MATDRTLDLAEVRQTLSYDAAGLRADLRRAQADGDENEVRRIERAMKTIEIDARLLAQAEHRARRRCERAEEARLHLAAEGIDPSRINAPQGDDPRIEHQSDNLLLPLLPGPPSWRTSVASFYGEADERFERERADALIALAVQDALSAHAALSGNSSARQPTRRLAMQLYDHHVARGENDLPPHNLELLARAMRVDPRQIKAQERQSAVTIGIAAGKTQRQIAAELGLSERRILDLRKRAARQTEVLHRHASGESDIEIATAMEIKENEVYVLRATALYAALVEGGDLRSHRADVAAALGLVGADGRWLPPVLAAVRGGVVEAELMREAACVDAKERLRRDPFVTRAERKLRKAHEAAEAARINGHDTAQADLELKRAIQNAQIWRRSARTKQNDEFAIAKAIGRDGAEVDPRKVRRWMDLPGWELLVLGEMIRLRNERARS